MSFKRPNMPKKMSEREKVYRALQRRRLKIADDCRQLKRDIEFYNKNNPHGAVIDVPSMDFTEEVLTVKPSAQGGG